MCSTVGIWPHVSRKMHSEWSSPAAGRAASSKYLNPDPLHVPRDPLVEDLAQERSEVLGGGRVLAHAALCPGRRLHHRKEAQEACADPAEEAIDGQRMLDVEAVHDAENIQRDAASAQNLVAAHRQPVRRLPPFIHPIGVVQLGGSVQAQADVKTLGRQKASPFLVDEHAVGLHAVLDHPPGRLVLALQVDGLPVEVHAQQRRLAAMPGEADFRAAGRGDVLDDVLLQHRVGHAGRAVVGIQFRLVQVVAVLAVEITDCSRRLGEDLKIP